MKTILKFIALSLILCSATTNAQDNQKWYADDIYYSSTEKDINYLEVIILSEEEEIEYEEIKDDYYLDGMSYSMRISRFHRDYYGSSINFNYGYFHDPYGFDYGFGCMPSYQPYYYNNWYGGYYGYNNYYSPWNSPWCHNQYAWNNPYGYNYGYGYGYGAYGYGYSPYYFDTPFIYSTNTTYGHRESLGNNISTNSSTNSDVVGEGRNPELTKKTSTTINRNDYTANTKKTSYKPKRTKRTYEYNSSRSSNTSSKTKVNTSSPSNSTRTKTTYKRPSTNTKSTYTPSRNSNKSSNTNRSTNTNRSSSTPSRRPR
jgi:hypothetical protein